METCRAVVVVEVVAVAAVRHPRTFVGWPVPNCEVPKMGLRVRVLVQLLLEWRRKKP